MGTRSKKTAKAALGVTLALAAGSAMAWPFMAPPEEQEMKWIWRSQGHAWYPLFQNASTRCVFGPGIGFTCRWGEEREAAAPPKSWEEAWAEQQARHSDLERRALRRSQFMGMGTFGGPLPGAVAEPYHLEGARDRLLPRHHVLLEGWDVSPQQWREFNGFFQPRGNAAPKGPVPLPRPWASVPGAPQALGPEPRVAPAPALATRPGSEEQAAREAVALVIEREQEEKLLSKR